MSAGNNTLFISRTGIYCILVLLLFSIFGVGTALAVVSAPLPNDDGSEAPSHPAYYDLPEDDILNYSEKIYISGETVTIETNIYSASFIRHLTCSEDGKTVSLDKNAYKILNDSVNGSVLQFNITPDHETYRIHFCGNIVNSSSHIDHILLLRVSAIEKDSADPKNEDEDSHKDVADLKNKEKGLNYVVYPLSGNFAASYTAEMTNAYYFCNYSHHFENRYSDSLFTELSGKNVVYSFDKGNLRSCYWYEPVDAFVFSDSNELSAYKPETVSVNFSQVGEIGLNEMFFCPEHDDFEYNSDKESIVSKPVPMSECTEELEWYVSVSGEVRPACDYLSPVELTPEEGPESILPALAETAALSDDENEPEQLLSHTVSFSNLSLLYPDLKNVRSILVSFYPDGFETGNFPLTFKRDGREYKLNPTVSDDGKITVFVDSDGSDPAVASFIFPEGTLVCLADASLILENLNPEAISDIEGALKMIDEENPIHAVINIDFESADSDITAELNAFLQKNDENVSLTFLIPKVLNGVAVKKEEISVFHVVEDNGTEKLERLRISRVVEKNIDGGYYAVTAETSGFSPFVLISMPVETESSSSPAGKAVVVPAAEENKPEESGYLLDLTPSSIPSFPMIIEQIQGQLSLFSILVVLMSGMFMWDYIRRRL